MNEARDVSGRDLEALARRASLDMSAEEIEALRPVYERYASEVAKLHDLDLDDGDLAVMFSLEEGPA